MADLDPSARNRIDELVGAAVEQGQAPGVVAGVARGDTVHVACAGTLSVGGPEMRRDTLFRITSNTKPITAACVLGLVEDGLLALDQPVDELLPELANRRVLRRPGGPLTDTVPAHRRITVRDLLTLTWGFGMQGAMFVAPEPWPVVTAEAQRQLCALGPPRPDDARTGDLAAAAGRTAAARAARRTLALQRGLARGRRPGCAGGRHAVPRRPARPGVRPARHGRYGVLRPETVAEMTRDQLTTAQRAAVWPGFDLLDGQGWGFGVCVHDDGSYGWDGGYGTTWTNVPSRGLTVVVLTQRAVDETGLPRVCADVLAAARG